MPDPSPTVIPIPAAYGSNVGAFAVASATKVGFTFQLPKNQNGKVQGNGMRILQLRFNQDVAISDVINDADSSGATFYPIPAGEPFNLGVNDPITGLKTIWLYTAAGGCSMFVWSP
jgi:hypothetical protein